jgi:AcrR family transcriptional regulator
MDSQVQNRRTPAKRLTRKGEATRARIVEGAAAEFRRRGVADTTLDHVIERTGTGKGQLFHYFPDGREELLVAVAEYEAERVITDQEPHLGRLATRSDWEAWRDAVVARYRRQGEECPLSMLISQIGNNSPAGRAVVTALLREWQDELAAGIRRTQERGEIGPSHDPERSAAAIVAAIQGGVLVLLSTGEIDNLEAALDFALTHLLEP